MQIPSAEKETLGDGYTIGSSDFSENENRADEFENREVKQDWLIEDEKRFSLSLCGSQSLFQIFVLIEKRRHETESTSKMGQFHHKKSLCNLIINILVFYKPSNNICMGPPQLFMQRKLRPSLYSSCQQNIFHF